MRHKMAIKSEYYICNKCGFRTTLLSKINHHLMVHDGARQPSPFSCFDCLKLLQCTICDFSTEFLELLRYHLVCNHNQQQFAPKVKLKTCINCGFCTHSSHLWIRHYIYGTCKGKKISKDKRKIIKKDGKWYHCEKCDYRTFYSTQLKNHITNKHTTLKEMDWQCPKCDYSTPYREDFQRHFNGKHLQLEDIKFVECHKCGVKFKDDGQLKKHFICHTTKNMEKCDLCDYQAKDKQLVRRHKKYTHGLGGFKWLKCEHCDYSCKFKSCLRDHVLVKHNIDGEVYQCKKCDYNSRSKHYLNIHIWRRHKQPEQSKKEKLHCTHCTYSCFKKGYLMKHLNDKHKINA